MINDLSKKSCKACNTNTPPLKGQELIEYARQLGNEWKILNDHHLEKEFTFNNFKEALDFTNKVGAIAEKEGHHPDIYLSYGKVKLTIWTHHINGLSESDFILAAKCNNFPS